MKIFSTNLRKVMPIALFFLIWGLSAAIIHHPLYWPGPLGTLQTLFRLIFQTRFWQILLSSTLRVLLGLFMSGMIGVGLGILSYRHPFFFEMMRPFLTLIRSTPVVSFIIVTMIWMKATWVPVFITLLMCLPLFWTGTLQGLKQTRKEYLEMAKIFRISSWKKIFWIFLPSLFPVFHLAVKNALGLSWKVSIAAEVISQPASSIGRLMQESKSFLETAELFSWTFVVIVCSALFEWIYEKALRNIAERRGFL